MVFLGGAVLANIVSQNQHSRIIHHADNVFCKDGRQARHVDLETGVGGAGRTSAGKIGCKVEIDLIGQNANVKTYNHSSLHSHVLCQRIRADVPAMVKPCSERGAGLAQVTQLEICTTRLQPA